MTTPLADEELGTRAALWAVALTGALLTLGSPVLLGKESVLGVALGAAVAVANLWALGRVVRALMNGAGLPWAVLGAVKLVGLLALVAFLLKLGITTLIPLGVGYCALPLGIVFSQLGGGRATSRQLTSPDLEGGVPPDSGPKG